MLFLQNRKSFSNNSLFYKVAIIGCWNYKPNILLLCLYARFWIVDNLIKFLPLWNFPSLLIYFSTCWLLMSPAIANYSFHYLQQLYIHVQSVQSYIIFQDFKKAFNSVLHDDVLVNLKLWNIGIMNPMCSLFCS